MYKIYKVIGSHLVHQWFGYHGSKTVDRRVLVFLDKSLKGWL